MFRIVAVDGDDDDDQQRTTNDMSILRQNEDRARETRSVLVRDDNKKKRACDAVR